MEIESTDPIVNDHLGDVLWMLGRKREAKFQWKKSLSFKPEFADQENTEKNSFNFSFNIKSDIIFDFDFTWYQSLLRILLIYIVKH